MIDHVWLLTDSASGDLSYVKHGKEGDEPSWKKVGPFAYTRIDAAADAAANPRFLPDGVDADLDFVQIDASAFVQAIFNGFQPSETDVLVLDDGFFPLTSGGAEWVDIAIGHPIWVPVFDESGGATGLGWLDRVLRQVAGRLDMNMETVQAIGSINAAAEDEAANVDQTGLLIQRHVRLVIIPEPGTLAIEENESHHVLSPAARFCLHTVGMGTFGLPELEIRDVPCWWVGAAGAELNGWAAFSLNKGICDGDDLDGGGPVPLKITATESPDREMWADRTKCLRLEVQEVHLPHGHHRHEPDGPKTVH